MKPLRYILKDLSRRNQLYLNKKMKFILFLSLILSSCSFVKKDNIPLAQKEDVEGVLLYEYKKNGDYYCELNNWLILDNHKFFFYDVRNFNVDVLHKNEALQKKVGIDTLYSHLSFEPDSFVNLNFSSLKNRGYNHNGVILINNPSFYSLKGEGESVFIAFNFKGEAIHYNSLVLQTVDYKEHAKECCPRKNANVNGEFYVLSRLFKTEKLKSNQEANLSLKKSEEIESIKILLCE